MKTESVIEKVNRLHPEWGFETEKSYIMHLRIDGNDRFVCGIEYKEFHYPKILQPYKVCKICDEFEEKEIGVSPLMKESTYEHIVKITEGDEPIHSAVKKDYAYAKQNSRNVSQ